MLLASRPKDPQIPAAAAAGAPPQNQPFALRLGKRLLGAEGGANRRPLEDRPRGLVQFVEHSRRDLLGLLGAKVAGIEERGLLDRGTGPKNVRTPCVRDRRCAPTPKPLRLHAAIARLTPRGGDQGKALSFCCSERLLRCHILAKALPLSALDLLGCGSRPALSDAPCLRDASSSLARGPVEHLVGSRRSVVAYNVPAKR